MLLPKFLSWKISPEKSLDFWSQKSVVRPALSLFLGSANSQRIEFALLRVRASRNWFWQKWSLWPVAVSVTWTGWWGNAVSSARPYYLCALRSCCRLSQVTGSGQTWMATCSSYWVSFSLARPEGSCPISWHGARLGFRPDPHAWGIRRGKNGAASCCSCHHRKAAQIKN